MLNLKKTAVAVLALGSSAVFAGTMGPVCTPGNVTVPCEMTAWDIGIYALYLENAHHNSWNFIDNAVVTNGVTHYNDDHSNWDWGFKLEGSYHFGTGNDFNVNWYHHKNDETSHGLTSTVYGALVSREMDQKWDAVNFEFGQHVDFGEMKDIRFHGGIQYVKIQHDNHFFVNNTTTALNNFHADFDGIGPRTGMDMTYNWGNGFAMYANAAAALLVGQHDFNDNLYNVTGKTTDMVPELEAKLGLKYDFAMANGLVSLDGGWMFVNYFNANHAVIGGTAVDSDFALHGPYLGVKWVGSI